MSCKFITRKFDRFSTNDFRTIKVIEDSLLQNVENIININEETKEFINKKII